MKKPAIKAMRRGGFTLLEVLLVVAILALLAAVVAPNLIATQKRAQVDLAHNEIAMLEDILSLYFQQNGAYPSTEQGLDALVKEPEEKPIPRSWAGPYVDDPKKLDDPWNSPYEYAYPGEFNKEDKPDIWSLGPDGEEETEDDIGNWTTDEEGDDDYENFDEDLDSDRGDRGGARSDSGARSERRGRSSGNGSERSRSRSNRVD